MKRTRRRLAEDRFPRAAEIRHKLKLILSIAVTMLSSEAVCTIKWHKKTVRLGLTVFTLQVVFKDIKQRFKSLDGLDIRLADTVDVSEIRVRRNVCKLIFGAELPPPHRP